MNFIREPEDIVAGADFPALYTNCSRERFKRSEDLKICSLNQKTVGGTLPNFQDPTQKNNTSTRTPAKLINAEEDIKKKILRNESVARIALEKTLFNQSNFVCGECFKVFSQPLSLTRHKIYHDKLVSSKLLNQSDKNDLKLQSNQHSEKKIFQCDECSFTFPYMSRLKVHKLTHTNTRKFRCNKCEYTCIRPQALKAHKMLHSGEKPFKCEECGHECRQLSHLKLHLITHISQKPYKCEICDMKFSFDGELKKHNLTHLG